MEGLANYLLKEAGLKQMLRLAEAVEKNPGRAAQRGVVLPTGILAARPKAGVPDVISIPRGQATAEDYRSILENARQNNKMHESRQARIHNGSGQEDALANPETVGKYNIHPTAEVKGTNQQYRFSHQLRDAFVNRSNYDAMRHRKLMSPSSGKPRAELDVPKLVSHTSDNHPRAIADSIESRLAGGEAGIGSARVVTSGKFTPKAYQQARSSARALPLPG